MALLITPGQWGDAPQMIEVLDRIRLPRLLAGRPRTGLEHFDRECYRRRNEVERTINRLKNSRAVATRYDKRAYVFHGTVTVAAVRLWLRPWAGSLFLRRRPGEQQQRDEQDHGIDTRAPRLRHDLPGRNRHDCEHNPAHDQPCTIDQRPTHERPAAPEIIPH